MGWLYVQSVLDSLVIVAGFLVPNPFDAQSLPMQVQLRFSNEGYFFLLIAASALSYSPRLVLWTGAVAAVVWSSAVGYIALQPETLIELNPDDFWKLTPEGQVELVTNPHRILVGVWIRQVLLMVLVAVTLAIAVARARRLVFQQASAERERANLSRYFSPKIVDELAQQPAELGETRQRDVTILFADLAGFTTLASEGSPEQVIELLRQYHRRVSREIFERDGTLEEYLGDGILATFGNPNPSGRDAANALRSALAIERVVDEWNQERAATAKDRLRVRVGLHRGSVVIGNVGEQQLQFAVVGDAVNVASRLQELGKELDACVVLSADVIAAARREGVSEDELAGLRDEGDKRLRGRDAAVRVWVLPTGTAGREPSA